MLTGPVGHDPRNTFLLALERDVDDQQAVVDAIGLSGPIHENVPAPMRHFFFSGRVFHDFSSGDQFWIGYSYENQFNGNMNVGGTVLPEAGFNSQFTENEINVSYRHVFSTAWANQLRFWLAKMTARALHSPMPRKS